MLGLPGAGLLVTAGCEREKGPLDVAPVAESEVRGHWTTGCGCGCDGCTYRWFMRDDIQYKLQWHPGKCKATQCACPCEHSKNHLLDFVDVE